MKRIAILSIIVEKLNDENVKQINSILHEYNQFVLGRMGVPDRVHNVNIISVALCAEQDILNSITGKLGKVQDVSAKLLFSKYEYES